MEAAVASVPRAKNWAQRVPVAVALGVVVSGAVAPSILQPFTIHLLALVFCYGTWAMSFGLLMGQLDAALRWLRPRVAICLVEHNMGFLLGIADAVTVLDHGQVIATGTPDTITADPAVRTAYLGTSYARH